MVNLKRLYQSYNRKYFQGKLPNIPVRYGKIKKDCLARTRFELDFHTPHSITISIKLKARICDSTTLMSLLHEMCHVALPFKVNHGKLFQREMLRLAAEGAFKDLW